GSRGGGGRRRHFGSRRTPLPEFGTANRGEGAAGATAQELRPQVGRQGSPLAGSELGRAPRSPRFGESAGYHRLAGRRGRTRHRRPVPGPARRPGRRGDGPHRTRGPIAEGRNGGESIAGKAASRAKRNAKRGGPPLTACG